MRFNRRKKNCSGHNKRGFSLIELLVSMFILAIVMGGMVAVSVSIFRSYQKSKAIKTITEDVGFALNSIAKDIRMGKVETENTCTNGQACNYLLISRNRGGRVCYRIDTYTIAVADYSGAGTDCSGRDYNNILVDLSVAGMQFDSASAPVGKAKFRSCPTDKYGTGAACNDVVGKRRGWAQINLDIENPSMETDAIKVQTTVSSRDYGW